MKDTNNLFDFATSELSQDAMIAWLCNWINFPDSKLFECAKEVLYMMAGNRNINLTGDITIERQMKYIDILISKKNEWTIIVEDKIASGHHSDQINRYINEIKNDSKYSDNIIVCYFKTGLHYDYDYGDFVKNIDTRITGEKFLSVLNKYAGISEILDDYITHLKKSCQWYHEIKKKLFAENYDDCVEALSYQYGQHTLFKEIFDSKNIDGPYLLYGTSGGRPWCQYQFAKIPFTFDNTSFDSYLFYKADYKYKKNQDQKRPFVSLRQYCRFKEENADMQEKIKKQKKEDFTILRDIFKQTLSEFPALKGMPGGNNGGYFESELGIFYLSENSFATLKENMMSFQLAMTDKIKKVFPQFEDTTDIRK